MSQQCSVCNKTFPEINPFVGVTIEIKPTTFSDEVLQSYKEQLAPYEVGKKYLICYPCWLNSMGVKP
jgi:hypothetical protein